MWSVNLINSVLRLLTGCATFEDALELAAHGDNKNVDKLVKVINVHSMYIGIYNYLWKNKGRNIIGLKIIENY